MFIRDGMTMTVVEGGACRRFVVSPQYAVGMSRACSLLGGRGARHQVRATSDARRADTPAHEYKRRCP